MKVAGFNVARASDGFLLGKKIANLLFFIAGGETLSRRFFEQRSEVVAEARLQLANAHTLCAEERFQIELDCVQKESNGRIGVRDWHLDIMQRHR